MKIKPDPVLSSDPRTAFTSLYGLLRQVALQLNGLTEGRIQVVHDAATAPPTGGSWAQGDVIRNSAPAEAGTAGSKYVITKWICTVSGSPGTWVACRSLTGN